MGIDRIFLQCATPRPVPGVLTQKESPTRPIDRRALPTGKSNRCSRTCPASSGGELATSWFNFTFSRSYDLAGDPSRPVYNQMSDPTRSIPVSINMPFTYTVTPVNGMLGIDPVEITWLPDRPSSNNRYRFGSRCSS